MNIWTDICVNLTNSRFSKDTDAVIRRALDAGVQRMIVTGTDLEHSLQAIELCEAYPSQLRCTVGCHPHDAKTMDDEKWQQLEALLSSPFVVAVGECGLDFDRNFSEPNQQIEVFIQQLELAVKYELPVYLHEREAHHEMLSILHQYRGKLNKLLLHCFTGNEEQLQLYLELNLYIGITGWVCDERRNHDLVEAIQLIPKDRLMLETDAPYLLPRNIQPKPKSNRNEPSFLPHVGEKISELMECPIDLLAATTTINSSEFFNWPINADLLNQATD